MGSGSTSMLGGEDGDKEGGGEDGEKEGAYLGRRRRREEGRQRRWEGRRRRGNDDGGRGDEGLEGEIERGMKKKNLPDG